MRLQIYEKKNDTTKAAYPPLRAVLPNTDSLPQVLLFFSLPPVCPQTAENALSSPSCRPGKMGPGRQAVDAEYLHEGKMAALLVNIQYN